MPLYGLRYATVLAFDARALTDRYKWPDVQRLRGSTRTGSLAFHVFMKHGRAYPASHESVSQAERLLSEDDNVRRLTNAEIGEFMQHAFAPLRCVAVFQNEGTRVALRLSAPGGREFFVEGKRVESLRDPCALRQYVADVKSHLMPTVVFNTTLRGKDR